MNLEKRSPRAYKLLETLAALSVETPEGQMVYCAAKYLLDHGHSQMPLSNMRLLLQKHGLIQASLHYHQLRGGRCANYIITPKGMELVKEKSMSIGTISWPGIGYMDSAPKEKVKKAAASRTPKVKAPIPKREPVSFPVIMTEKEEKAMELLLSLSKEVGSNGTSVKRIINPENILFTERLAENYDEAEDIVCSLVQHCVLRQIAENERDGIVRRTYSVQSIKAETAKTVPLGTLKESLCKFLQEAQEKMAKLFERRNALREESDRINAQISALDEEMERVFKEEVEVKEKLASFNTLLSEASRELSV